MNSIQELLLRRPRVALHRITDPVQRLAVKEYILNKGTRAEAVSLAFVLALLAGCAGNANCPNGYYMNYSHAYLQGKANAPQSSCWRCQSPDCAHPVSGPDELPLRRGQ